MAEKRSLSKGGLYYLIYNVLNLAFPFINGIYVARVLLPESIGSVAAAQNFAQYFVIIAFLGIPTYGLREIAKARNNRTERDKVYSELYIINFISTLVFLTLYLILIITIPKYRSELPLYLISGLAIALNAFNISWLYEGMEEFRFISLRNLFFKVFVFLLLVLLVRQKDDALKYALIAVIGIAGNNIVNMIYSPRLVRLTTKDLNLKRHMKSILYLVAVNLAIELYSLMDITMMNFMSTKESIAFYKYGQQIERILLQVVNTFTMVLIPRLSYYYKENRLEEYNRLISKAFKLIVIVSIPMIFGIYYTADFILVSLYGEGYLVSAKILKLLSILLFVSPVGYLLGSRVLLVTDHENLMILSVGIGAVVNFIGNFCLIPMYSEFGAALASVASEVVVMAVYLRLGRKYFRLTGVSKTVIDVLVSSIVSIVYLSIISKLALNGWIVLILQVAGTVILYFGLLLLLKNEIVTSYYNIVKNRKR